MVKYTSIRVHMATVAMNDFHLHQMDVVTAFRHGDVDMDLFMFPPTHLRDPLHQNLIFKLHKALYGLKQAPRMWYEKIDTYLTSLGFVSSTSDLCLYCRHWSGSMTIVELYVDYLLLESNTIAEIITLKEDLYLGEAYVCLGLDMGRHRPSKSLHLSQSLNVHDVLRRFGMSSCSSVATPMFPRLPHIAGPITRPYSSSSVPLPQYPYQQSSFSLLFLVMGSRPDIPFPVWHFA